MRWTNDTDQFMWTASDIHPTHQEYAGFDAFRPIATGGTWSFLFDTAGVWGYHNHMDPDRTGTVIVKE